MWAPSKEMPEGASSTTAVRSALAELLENRQERQQGAASVLKRASLSVSKRVSGAIASKTLSNSVRVGIAGPVGAGKTSLATSLAIALERLVPYWSGSGTTGPRRAHTRSGSCSAPTARARSYCAT